MIEYDLLVVGGGINGAGIARDAASRGMKVLLCERDDLAAHTSSASTKLIHGGLRYLEYREFSLVRKALQEREVLLRNAPHIMWPLRFVMPHMPHLRPAWLIRIGLFLYDHLAKRRMLAASCGVDLRRSPVGAPLVDSVHRGFIYSDGWVDDARLVTLNALAAAELGATIATRACVTAVRRIPADGGQGQPGAQNTWEVAIDNRERGLHTVRARAIANAAGPWVSAWLKDAAAGVRAHHAVRLVKGSHIVVKRLFAHDHAYIFQNPDKRIIFAIPYETDFTLIGTTDVEYERDASTASISTDEIAYLCDSVNRYLKQRVDPADVVWTYSGVRPLLEEPGDNPSAVTRDYKLELDMAPDQAPLLSVFGGKITTYRKLAEQAVDLLSAPLGVTQPSATENVPLPGGDIPDSDFGRFAERLGAAYPWLPAALAHRYARAYGTRTAVLLDGARELPDLGVCVAPATYAGEDAGLYEAELRYLRDHEWARSAEDVLWRRSKLGLHAARDAATRVDDWFAQTPVGPAASRDVRRQTQTA